MSSTTITRGNAHEVFYIGPNLTPSAVSTDVTAAQTFSVPGLLASDYVLMLGLNGTQTAGIFIAQANVSAAGTLSIQFGNVTGSSATPAAGVYVMKVIRLEDPLPANAA